MQTDLSLALIIASVRNFVGPFTNKLCHDHFRIEATCIERAHNLRSVSVSDPNMLGLRSFDGRHQVLPVNMIRKHKPAIDGTAPSNAAHAHPTRSHACRHVAKAA